MRAAFRIAVVLAAAIMGLAAYMVFPRHPDLRAFDPETMARTETLTWRHYYEKRYAALFADLYGLSRREFGFSPWDSLRIAVAAARAARSFQPSTSRQEANAALPMLRDYFGLLARAAPVPVDIEAAARTELDWWQARREDVAPADYGLTVARVSTLLYGVDGEELRRSGILRAEAMAYRDAHAADIREADWDVIRDRLATAYRLLKQAVARVPA
jgi:hypothetical protein